MGGKSTSAMPAAAAQQPAQQKTLGITPDGYRRLGETVSSVAGQFGQAMSTPMPEQTGPMNPMAQTPGLSMQFPGAPASRPQAPNLRRFQMAAMRQAMPTIGQGLAGVDSIRS
jgi:hypothetical protein